MSQSPPKNAQPPAKTPPPSQARPNPFAMFFHIGKTARLAGAILRDPRVSIFRKLFFLVSIAVLLLALAAPETIGAVVSNVIPLVGPAIDIPADVTLDWVAVAVAAFNLMRIFPDEIVSEHYDRLFRAQPSAPRA